MTPSDPTSGQAENSDKVEIELPRPKQLYDAGAYPLGAQARRVARLLARVTLDIPPTNAEHSWP